MKRRKEGFTLVELLIVMAVIAALMGALVPVALNAIKHANATKIAENLRAIQSAVQNYAYSEHAVPGIGVLKSGNYLNGQFNTGDYSIYYKNGSHWYAVSSNGTEAVSNATMTVAIVYTGKIVSGDLIHNAWAEATTTQSPVSGDAYVTTTIAKYW